MDDSREAWLEALAEVSEPHRHSWFRCTQIGDRTVFHCSCGDRRFVSVGESPDSVPSSVLLGGSPANALITINQHAPLRSFPDGTMERQRD